MNSFAECQFLTSTVLLTLCISYATTMNMPALVSVVNGPRNTMSLFGKPRNTGIYSLAVNQSDCSIHVY